MGREGKDRDPENMGAYGGYFYLCVSLFVCPGAPSGSRAQLIRWQVMVALSETGTHASPVAGCFSI
eukprot:7178470-Pyramimonas_sp.AAC.1